MYVTRNSPRTERRNRKRSRANAYAPRIPTTIEIATVPTATTVELTRAARKLSPTLPGSLLKICAYRSR